MPKTFIIREDSSGVEVEAFGGEQALQHYKDRLRRGPRAARVDEVQEQVIEYQEYPTFEVIS